MVDNCTVSAFAIKRAEAIEPLVPFTGTSTLYTMVKSVVRTVATVAATTNEGAT